MPTMEVTTMVGCPLMCTFCPQAGLKSEYESKIDAKRHDNKYLSVEIYQIMLGKIPKHVRIDFSGMAEPWANPECTAMLEYTLKQGYSVAIYSTLYGMSDIDSDKVIELLKLYLNQIGVICIHLPDRNGNMRGWKYSLEWERNFLKFLSLRDEGIISRFEIMTMDGSGKIHEALDHLKINCGMWHGHSRAGSLPEDIIEDKSFYSRAPRHTSAISCASTPFYDHNVLLPNGDVALCCMDYNLKHILGNLTKINYYDLFAGDEIRNLIKLNMSPSFTTCSICKSCDNTVRYEVNEEATWINPEQKRLISQSAKYTAYLEGEIDAINRSIYRSVPRKIKTILTKFLG